MYVTDNAAYTWAAAVQETVDATLNRTVSSGNFLPLVGLAHPFSCGEVLLTCQASMCKYMRRATCAESASFIAGVCTWAASMGVLCNEVCYC